jgi:hypothetical protein
MTDRTSVWSLDVTRSRVLHTLAVSSDTSAKCIRRMQMQRSLSCVLTQTVTAARAMDLRDKKTWKSTCDAATCIQIMDQLLSCLHRRQMWRAWGLQLYRSLQFWNADVILWRTTRSFPRGRWKQHRSEKWIEATSPGGPREGSQAGGTGTDRGWAAAGYATRRDHARLRKYPTPEENRRLIGHIFSAFLFICAYYRRLLALHMDIQSAYRKPGRYKVQMLSGNIEMKYVAYGFFEKGNGGFTTSTVLRLFFHFHFPLLSHGRGFKGRFNCRGVSLKYTLVVCQICLLSYLLFQFLFQLWRRRKRQPGSGQTWTQPSLQIILLLDLPF